MPLSNPSSLSSSISSTTGTSLVNSLSGTASLIAPANVSRKNLTIYNPLLETVYIDVSNAVTSTAYMVPLEPRAYFEFPSIGIYVGDVYAILATGTGSINITEFV